MDIHSVGMRGPRKLGGSKEFLTFSLGIALLATFFGVLSLSSPAGLFAVTNNTTNRSSDFVDYQGSSNNCPTWVGIPNEEVSGNETDIKCLQRVLQKCQPFDFSLGYALGSMMVSVRGLTDKNNNIEVDACSLNLIYEIERGQTNMSCVIPLPKMSTWTSWKRGDGLDAVQNITNYCTVQ